MRPKLKRGELRVTGTNASEKIALRLRAGEPGILEIDVDDDGSAEFAFERSEIARIAVSARPGDDLVRIDEANGVFTDQIETTLAGGRGNDTLAGGRGVETLLGGIGNDSIDGNGGNDASLMGPGDDTFVWDPGDGSDVVEGQAGTDTMLFNGANVAEQVDVSANGDRLTFFRNPGTVTMDTAGVERVDFKALGGADLVTVNDLTATDVNELDRRPRSHPRRRHRRRPGRPRRRQRHRRQRRDRRQRRRRRSEGRRPRPDDQDPPLRGSQRPARDRHPRGHRHGRLRRPGRRCDPALRGRRARPVEKPARKTCGGLRLGGPRGGAAMNSLSPRPDPRAPTVDQPHGKGR